MKKSSLFFLITLCVITSGGAFYTIIESLALDEQLAEISMERKRLETSFSEQITKEKIFWQEQLSSRIGELKGVRTRTIKEWQNKKENLLKQLQSLEEECAAVKNWKEGKVHEVTPRLFHCKEGEANKVSGSLGQYLESFTVSDNSLRFDYHNKTSGRINPNYTIRLFDIDGNFIDSVSVVWLFKKLNPGAIRAETKLISRGNHTPYYYQLLED